MIIKYKVNHPISVAKFSNLLINSTLSKRRPINDNECLKGMVENSNLIVSAWHNDQLVGISRCVIDFHYACYLSDLAVHLEYQKLGIGRELQVITQNELGPKCKLILIAAPAANGYYPKLGYSHNDRCWVLNPNEKLCN